MRDFPSIEEAVAIHDILVRETGGAMGLRDPGALASAVLRPQLGYYEDMIQEAAAMTESLAMNHPFVDGNKPTALAVTDAFLRLNGSYIDCDGEEAYRFVTGLFETNSFRSAQLAVWLRDHVRPLTQP